MKKKMLLSLILIVLVSLSMTLCKVQAAGDSGATTPTITDTPTATPTVTEPPMDTPLPSVIEPTLTPTTTVTPTPNPTTTATPTPTPTGTTEGDYTDFSKAEIKINKDNINAFIEVKNVKLEKEHTYYFKIGSSSNIDITPEKRDGVITEKDDGICRSSPISKYIELNQDIYVSILESYVIEGKSYENVVVSGKKLERYSEPKYADAFRYTFMSSNMTQIVTNFSHDNENDRKMQIKVGKITDTKILNKIKNKDVAGFSELLAYAKSSNSLFDKTLDCEKSGSIGYRVNGDLISGLQAGLQDGAYYYLYVKPDNENGKYYNTEAVTLAQANVYPSQNSWYLFFYGDENFKWAEFGESGEGKKDDTIAPDKIIPQTGAKSLITLSILSVIFAGGVMTYIGYRKNNYK